MTALRRAAEALGVLALFVAALVLGAALHSITPVGREVLRLQINKMLASSLNGRLVIDEIDALGLGGAGGVHARLFDPDGVLVARASDVDVEASVVGVVGAILAGEPVVIDRVRATSVALSLDLAADGELRVANALEPRAGEEDEAPSAPVRGSIPLMIIEGGRARGDPGVAFDAHVLRARGSASIAGDVVRLGGTLHARVHGAPGGVDPVGRWDVEAVFDDEVALDARFEGGVTGGVPIRAGATLRGERIDGAIAIPWIDAERLRALVPRSPLRGAISARATARGAVDDLTLWASVRLDTRASASALGHLRGERMSARATLAYDRARANLDVELDEARITARAAAGVGDLGLLERLDPSAEWSGTSTIDARAAYDRQRRTLEAQARARGSLVARDGVSAGALDLRAEVRGALDDPEVSLQASATDLRVPHTAIEAARLSVRGRAGGARVQASVRAGQSLDLDARVAARDGLAVHWLRVTSGSETLLSGSGRWSDDRGHVIARAPGIDLWRVGAALGLDVPVGGRVALAVDAHVTREALSGWAVLDAERLTWDRWEDASAHVRISALGGAATIDARARAPGTGWASLTAFDVRLDGQPWDLGAWRRATGSAQAAAFLSLEALAPLLPPSVPARGFGHVVAVASRAPGQRPNVSAELTTIALGERDVRARASIAPSGAASVAAEVFAGEEDVGTLRALAHLPWDRVIGGDVDLRSTELVIEATVDERDARRACAWIDLPCAGSVSGRLRLEGTMASWRGRLTARLDHFRTSVLAADTSATIEASFERGRASGVVHAQAAPGEALIAYVHASASEELSDWTLSTRARLERFPLRIPYDAAWAEGRVSGSVVLRDWRRDARLDSRVTVDDLTLAPEAPPMRAWANASFDGQALEANVSLETTTGGALHAALSTEARWETSLVPEIGERAQIRVGVRASDYPLQTLSTFVPTEVGEISGRLAGDLSVIVSRDPPATSVRGRLDVTSAIVRNPFYGTLQDVGLVIRGEGDGVVHLEEARARNGGGWLRGHGRAVVRGAAMERASLELTMPEAQPFPIFAKGDHVADVSGRASVRVVPSAERTDVVLRLPSLRVMLPAASPKELQDLEPSAAVAIGVARQRGGFEELPLGPPSVEASSEKPLVVDVRLGDDVVVVQEDEARARVTGGVRVELRDALKVTGRIEAKGGHIEVSGKRFRIERAVATFTGDPANPRIDAVAAWDAPDGSTIYADYNGPLDGGKVALRSDPARTGDDIVSLLIFGTTSGPSMGTTSATTAALGAGVAIATQPLNKVISQLTTLDIRTRVDTSGRNPRPGLEVQIARDISAQIAYVLGVPPPGTNPDKYWLTLAWRVGARFTLDAKVGDRGSSILELTWHYRY